MSINNYVQIYSLNKVSNTWAPGIFMNGTAELGQSNFGQGVALAYKVGWSTPPRGGLGVGGGGSRLSYCVRPGSLIHTYSQIHRTAPYARRGRAGVRSG